MTSSLDGRIVTDGWPMSGEARKQYEEIHNEYGADGWMCGRVTFEEHFVDRVRSDAELAHQYSGPPREDFVAPGDHASYVFALDTHGRLLWESNAIDGDHVVAVLAERVSDEYLTALRAHGVSYLLAGAPEIDLPRALTKIYERFDVKTLMLEGGGRINGAMLRAGLVDEVSVLIAPVIDGRMGEPTLFDDASGHVVPRSLTWLGVEKRAGDVLWARYRVGLSDQ